MGDNRLKTLLLFVVWLIAPQTVVSQEPIPPVYRLPTTVTPQMYLIRLEPDLDTGVLKGTVKIQVNTTSDESQTLTSISLHAGLNVMVNETTGIIIDMDGKVQDIGAFNYDDDNTLLTLVLPEGKTLNHSHIYVISLQFQSLLNSEPKGLFYGYFNATSKYVAANFRPTHARDVFPCFDEPHFKVPIGLQVLRPASYFTSSTAALAYSTPIKGEGKVLDTFSNTDAISIHSLGLFISERPSVESMGVSVVVPPSVPTTVPYLDTLIAEIAQQYGPFPTGRLTLIVLPDRALASFSSYGFVFTSPEVYLREVGSPLQWTRMQRQLTEEFLRQYLEYSKTPQWWSDVWLSESVGAYLALSLQQDEPWLNDWLKIVIRNEALGHYTTASDPVITSQNLSKYDIENIVSSRIVKVKGLSTLLMWNDTMPEGLVDQTLLDFLRLPLSVVSSDDLVNLMAANIKANTTYNVTAVIPLLPNWLTQPGSPLVWFTVDSNTTFTLDQGTLCPAGGAAPALRPISVALAQGSTPDWSDFRQDNWLLNNATQYALSSISAGAVINIETAPFRVNYNDYQWGTLIQALNTGWAPVAVASALQDDAVAHSLQGSPFRVNYNDSQWDTLIQALNTGWAPVAVASALQDDAVALSFQGCLDFSTALSVLNSTQHSSMDWWPVVKAAEAITAVIGSDYYGFTAFGSYFASLFTADLLDQLDVRKSLNYSELSVARELVTPWICRFNISTCREAVVELGGPLWQGNTSGIAGSDLENVACYGARYTPGALAPLLDAYHSAENVMLRRYFTIALSCLTEQSSVNGLLTTIINSNSTSSQVTVRSGDSEVTLDQSDARQILIGLASSLENSQAILDFVLSQPLGIQTKFGVGTLSAVIKNLAANRVDLSQLSTLQDKTVDLDPYVLQAVDEAMVASNLSQTWYSNYSSKLYLVLPEGDNVTTTTPTSLTSVATGSSPGSGSTSSTTGAPTPAPGCASTLSSVRVFTLVLTALFISLDIMVR